MASFCYKFIFWNISHICGTAAVLSFFSPHHFIQDSVEVPSPIQSARAANIIYAMYAYRKQIFKEKLEPVSLIYNHFIQ